MDVGLEFTTANDSAASRLPRARGQVRAAFARAGARTEAARVFETGGLRLRFPSAGVECEAVLVNTGGGMAGGDQARVELSLQPGARVLATTQSAEKIYRADGAPTHMQLRLEVGAGAALVWAPQETLLYDGSDMRRPPRGRCRAGRLADDPGGGGVRPSRPWRDAHRRAFSRRLAHPARRPAHVRRGGAARRRGRDADRPAVGAGARAIATLLWIDPGAPSRLDDLRAALDAAAEGEGERLEAGAGLLEGALVARLASPAPRRLRQGVTAALRCLRGREAPRVWS